jgi:DNA-binding IclR family transcriptional regulator
MIMAAVTISGPAQRFTEEKVNQYIPEILHVGEQISRYLGYLGRY